MNPFADDEMWGVFMVDIQPMICPSCGGPISGNITVCSYCGTKIVLSGAGMGSLSGGCLCPACGENNNEAGAYCWKCGRSLPVKRCQLCENVIPLNSVHCPYCGRNLEVYEAENRIARLEERKSNKEVSFLLCGTTLALSCAFWLTDYLGLALAMFGVGMGTGFWRLTYYFEEQNRNKGVRRNKEGPKWKCG
jgi:hypothetical protein